MEGNNSWVLYVVIALVIGAGGGYWYGNSTGQETGRAMLLAEQEGEALQAQEDAQQEIVDAANPFDEGEGVLGEGYQNPFDTVNPFAQ